MENELMDTASEMESELGDLHRALDDATELLAAFLSSARGGELPPAFIINATDQIIDRVAEWRSIVFRTRAALYEGERKLSKLALH